MVNLRARELVKRIRLVCGRAVVGIVCVVGVGAIVVGGTLVVFIYFVGVYADVLVLCGSY